MEHPEKELNTVIPVYHSLEAANDHRDHLAPKENAWTGFPQLDVGSLETYKNQVNKLG